MDFFKSYLYKIRPGVVILYIFIVGCAHYRASPYYAGPKPLPETVAEYYSYQKTDIASRIESIKEKERYVIKRIRLNSGKEKMVIEFFQSNRKGISPCLLILPILGGNYPIEREFAEFFASEGIHCAIIHRRKYKKIPDEGLEYMEKLIRQAVINNRLIIDFLTQQENVDETKIGTFGISMGGINAALTAAVEPARFKAHIIALAGGNIADILRDTKDPVLTKPVKEYLKKRNITMDEFYADVKRNIKSDPVLLADYIDARKVLMFIAVFDRTLMRKNGVKLWRAIGKPEVIYIPLGHYSSYFAKEYVKAKSLQFYRKAFGGLKE